MTPNRTHATHTGLEEQRSPRAPCWEANGEAKRGTHRKNSPPSRCANHPPRARVNLRAVVLNPITHRRRRPDRIATAHRARGDRAAGQAGWAGAVVFADHPTKT